jgi:hypothetical protein
MVQVEPPDKSLDDLPGTCRKVGQVLYTYGDGVRVWLCGVVREADERKNMVAVVMMATEGATLRVNGDAQPIVHPDVSSRAGSVTRSRPGAHSCGRNLACRLAGHL